MASSKKNPSAPFSGLGIPVSPVASVSANTSELPVTATVNIAPAAAAKLGADGGDPPVPGADAESALPGWQSLGKDHKPTHSFGKQGRREKKVRW
ncbi:hypothetical protein QMA10_01075 [Arthrobacter sp. APC 3897]|uniref:hypothetical protein n=1 Tax=Arthrobacter sp. APC 3897 TaxID=3035204 RepID=UPI0025B2B79E|nr:hypothetical protein [Arthrobacter sp. APC 3897]MDN3480519.1 hypothetical protein [Arthrobacter sp. APC 3897]